MSERADIERAIARAFRPDSRMTRRSFLRQTGRGAVIAGSALTIPSILAACGIDPASSGGRVERRGARMPPERSSGRTGRSTSTSTTTATTRASSPSPRRPASRSTTPRRSRTTPTSWARSSPTSRPGTRPAGTSSRPAAGWSSVSRGSSCLEELDHSQLPNWTANAADYAKGLWFDPDNRYSLWWQGGITGIAYDPELTGREITTFDDLLDPAFAGGRRRVQRHARHVRADAAVPRRRAGERDRRRRDAGARQAARGQRRGTSSAATTATSTTTRWRPATSPSRSPGRATSPRCS